MSEWLQRSFQTHGGPAPWVLAWRLLIALLLGWAIAAIYRRTHRTEPVAPTFPPTLVLLTLLIATVTQVIGDNVARAFSLVGALSIVRFRTVVQDTRDTAFVIFAVIEGMAVGAGHLWVALVALAIIGPAAILGEPRRNGARPSAEAWRLSVRVALGRSPDALLEQVSDRYLERAQVTEVATAGRGSGIEATYRVQLRPDASPAELVDALNSFEGVQSVGLERANASA
jgi:hypothetical protein